MPFPEWQDWDGLNMPRIRSKKTALSRFTVAQNIIIADLQSEIRQKMHLFFELYLQRIFAQVQWNIRG